MRKILKAVFTAAKTVSLPLLILLLIALSIYDNVCSDGEIKNYVNHLVLAVILIFIFFSAGVFLFILFIPADKDDLASGKSFCNYKKCSRLFRKGVDSLNSAKFNDALQFFQQVESMKTSDDEKAVLFYYLGRCYHLMGYPTNAIKYYSMAINNNFRFTDAYYNAARCCVMNSMYVEAEEYYSRMHSANPDADYYYTEIGMMYIKQEKAEQALEMFQFSIDNHMNYAFAVGGASIAMLLLKNFDESKKLFIKAIINNIYDPEGFKQYYSKVAEAVGFDISQISSDESSDSAEKEPIC